MCKVKPDNATLLGAPIGQLNSINSAILGRLQALKTMGSRLSHFRRQDPLLLLRQSVAIPKILYTLRTAPCCISPELASFNQELGSILANILNVSIDNHSTWVQATLPVRAGGLGILRATQLAPSAFLASAAGCKDLLAVQAKESGEWLNALPVPSLDDEVVRIAAGLRLGVPLCRPHPCSQCGGHVDEPGTHGLSCTRASSTACSN